MSGQTATPVKGLSKNESQLADLQTISKLFHLIFHRNKNQHRLTKWWRWFAMLRRSTDRLLAELQTFKSVPPFGDEAESCAHRANARIEYISEILVARCHLAFKNLISDNQFAPLGLVLMANLARLDTILSRHYERKNTHLPRRYHEEILAKEEELRSAASFANPAADSMEADKGASAFSLLDASFQDMDDLGEVVARDDTFDRDVDTIDAHEGVDLEGIGEGILDVDAGQASSPERTEMGGNAKDLKRDEHVPQPGPQSEEFESDEREEGRDEPAYAAPSVQSARNTAKQVVRPKKRRPDEDAPIKKKNKVEQKPKTEVVTTGRSGKGETEKPKIQKVSKSDGKEKKKKKKSKNAIDDLFAGLG